MRTKRHWLTFLWTFPWDILAWFALLLIRAILGKESTWVEGWWVILREDSFFVKKLYRNYGGTTFGHGGILRGSVNSVATANTLKHELVHVEQFEATMLTGFVITIALTVTLLAMGITPVWWISVALWVLSWPIAYSCAALQAVVRGEPGYKGSTLEESAYALVRDWEKRKSGD